MTAARDSGFTMFIDLCAVDYLTRNPRFEVVIGLLSLDPLERLRLLVGIPGDDPTIPSITGLFAGADFYEREAFDLFGIQFSGHPNLTRSCSPTIGRGIRCARTRPSGRSPSSSKKRIGRHEQAPPDIVTGDLEAASETQQGPTQPAEPTTSSRRTVHDLWMSGTEASTEMGRFTDEGAQEMLADETGAVLAGQKGTLVVDDYEQDPIVG